MTLRCLHYAKSGMEKLMYEMKDAISTKCNLDVNKSQVYKHGFLSDIGPLIQGLP